MLVLAVLNRRLEIVSGWLGVHATNQSEGEIGREKVAFPGVSELQRGGEGKSVPFPGRTPFRTKGKRWAVVPARSGKEGTVGQSALHWKRRGKLSAFVVSHRLTGF